MFGEAQLYYDYERANDMLDNIYPSMIGHNYLTAFKIFIEDYTKYFNKGIALKNYDLDENGFLQKKYVPPIFISLLAGGIVSFIIVSIMVKKNKMIKKANDATEYADKSALKYNVKQDILTGSITTSHRISSDSGGSSGGGGFHSSSGSSGGGHTSGGGRHG